MQIDTSAWTDIRPKSEDAAGRAYNRAERLFRNDPFVRMFAPEVITALLAAIFSTDGVACNENRDRADDHLRVADRSDVRFYVMPVLDKAPLAFVTSAFKEHLADLVAFAIFPHDNLISE